MTKPTIRRKPVALADMTTVTLLDRDQLAAKLGIGLWTLNAMVKAGTLPRPITLTSNIHRWRVSDVSRWLDDLARRPHLCGNEGNG